MPASVKIFDCPYCPRTGVGSIVVHGGTAIRMADERCGSMRLDLADGDPNGLIVFNPDGHPNRPCPHLIAMGLDVRVEFLSRRQTYAPLSLWATWQHPWFEQGEPGEHCARWLWGEVIDGTQVAFYPTT